MTNPMRQRQRRAGVRPQEDGRNNPPTGEAAVSAVSFREIALLHDKGRLTLLRDLGAWRGKLFRDGLTEIPVDGEIGIRAAELADFHRDPADRLIVATALGGHRPLDVRRTEGLSRVIIAMPQRKRVVYGSPNRVSAGRADRSREVRAMLTLPPVRRSIAAPRARTGAGERGRC